MSTVGLITEYNPFHLGHKYHISEAKRLTGADTAIVIMSGNYVQRGEPSFADKYTKTKIALNNGADLVIELPYCFACASAEYFAYGAVSILDRLGVTDFLCFGAENNDINTLTAIADILSSEPDMYRSFLNNELKKGISFPQARETALGQYTGWNTADIHNILSAPNNILAIEYLKALSKLKSSIKPVSLKRINASYHDNSRDKRFYSAAAIRSLAECSYDDLRNTLDNIDNHYLSSFMKSFPILPDDFSVMVGYSLHTHIFNNTLNHIFGMTKALSNRIRKNMGNYINITQFSHLLKTKDISYTAVSRALLHCVLNIFSDDMAEYMDNDICSFVRVLGFSADHDNIFNLIKASSDMEIITGLKGFEDNARLNPTDRKLIRNGIYCDNLYRMVCSQKYNSKLPTEYASFLQKTKNKFQSSVN